MLKDDVLHSEILWALKMVVPHYSFNSPKNTSELFTRMFPDSESQRRFAVEKEKPSISEIAEIRKELKLSRLKN